MKNAACSHFSESVISNFSFRTKSVIPNFSLLITHLKIFFYESNTNYRTFRDEGC